MADVKPTLEDLRASPTPAWLWDAGRGRVVWANAAGVAALDATSLFDLIDRSFDPREAGVARLAEVGRNLEAGAPVTTLLHFPSAGRNVPFSATVWLHRLADGLPGVLVLEVPPKPELAAPPESVAARLVDHLPLALFTLEASGQFRHANVAARAFLNGRDASGLGAFLESDTRAVELLARVAASPLVTSTEQVQGRDLKCVLSAVGDGLYQLMVEDVTTRRALEMDVLSRQIRELDVKAAEAAKPVLSANDAFEHLGKSIAAAVQAPAPKEAPTESPQDTPKQAAPEPIPEPVLQPVKVAEAPILKPVIAKEPAPPAPKPVVVIAPKPSPAPHIPDAVRLSLERTGKAILVGRDDTALFATLRAAQLLGCDDTDTLLQQHELWDQLRQAESGATLSLPAQGGETLAFTLTRARVPWLSGPADQFVLEASLPPPKKPEARLKLVPELVVADTAGAVAAAKTESKPEARLESKSDDAPAAHPAEVEKTDVAPAPAAEDKASKNVVADMVLVPAARPVGSTISHDELKAILDVASDGIITLDTEGLILSFSGGAEAIFGISEDQAKGRALASLLRSDSRKVLRDYLSGLSGPGLASVFNDGREVQAVTAEGNSLPLFLTVNRLQSPQSSAALCAVVRDITTWKRTESELRDAKEVAETASRQKSEFLARISHELRTPLNAIMGFSEVMQAERFGPLRNEKYRAYANDIHTSGQHLLALINDLLDLSKVEAGKLELDFTSESVADATEHAMRLLQEDARKARVLMRTAFPARLPRVVADHRSLRQIMLNLLSNAVKYTNAGGQVVVSAHIEPDGALTVRVKDTGIGMTEEQLSHALEPFTRVETVDRDRQGTGLGLPLTKALTEANRATLKLSSQPNQGTTVDVTFPGTRVLAE